jgi:hypothetical protein
LMGMLEFYRCLSLCRLFDQLAIAKGFKHPVNTACVLKALMRQRTTDKKYKPA